MTAVIVVGCGGQDEVGHIETERDADKRAD